MSIQQFHLRMDGTHFCVVCNVYVQENFHVDKASMSTKPTPCNVTRLVMSSFDGPASHAIHFRHCFQSQVLGDQLLPPRPSGSLHLRVPDAALVSLVALEHLERPSRTDHTRQWW